MPTTEADWRRAAALVIHHARRDVAGINAILTEADQADRNSDLLMALLGLYAWLMPHLHTPAGLAILQEAVVAVAAMEEGEQP